MKYRDTTGANEGRRIFNDAGDYVGIVRGGVLHALRDFTGDGFEPMEDGDDAHDQVQLPVDESGAGDSGNADG